MSSHPEQFVMACDAYRTATVMIGYRGELYLWHPHFADEDAVIVGVARRVIKAGETVVVGVDIMASSVAV
jgi:hypothetical protein